jgi:hypothetical protein
MTSAADRSGAETLPPAQADAHSLDRDIWAMAWPAILSFVVVNVVDVIDKNGLYQGQTYGDETHFVCPWHGYEYDLKTGECIGDRKLKLRKYEIVKRGEDIYVVA